MALGTYGITRPADMSPEDVEIIMNYTPSRDVTQNFVLKKLDAASLLTPYFNNNDTGGNTNEILGGLYNLKLPASEFNALGIYTLYIRPAEIRTNNVDPQYRNKFVNQGLVGFRVEYLNEDGSKIPNFFRIITSSFYCEPVTTNLVNTQQKQIRYRYVEAGSDLLFCTLSPSSAPSNKPSATPFIGQPNQNIIITNTYFNPVTVEIEMAQYDIDTLAIALYGNQTKSIEDGIYTLYDTNNNIYQQYNLFEVRDEFNNLLYEVRQNRGDNIDFSKNFNSIIQ
jgi:hypothetical protein